MLRAGGEAELGGCDITGVFSRAPVIGGPRVPESVRPDAVEQGDCSDEKDLQTQVFSKAAEGIRTLDLLHGKQTL